MSFGPDERLYVKADDVVWREAGDELVVLELTTTTYLTLNGTAKQLWLGLLDGATVEELIGTLSGQYGISAEQARADTESFVSALTERALLSTAAPA
jgi:hypothetical protein